MFTPVRHRGQTGWCANHICRHAGCTRYLHPHVAVGGCVAMATSVGLVASATEATVNSGSLSDDVLDVGVGWGVSVSRQMRQTSLLLAGAVVTGCDCAGVNVWVEAGGG